MIKAIIEPLVGVKLGKHELRFGMERYEIEEFLGVSDLEEQDEDYPYVSVSYNMNSYYLTLEYDLDRLVSVGIPSESYIRPELFGKDVFDTEADELIEIVREHDPELMEDDDGTDYISDKLKLILWREESPEDYRNYLADMRDTGRDPKSAKHREEAEKARLGCARFASVTCAAPGYLD